MRGQGHHQPRLPLLLPLALGEGRVQSRAELPPSLCFCFEPADTPGSGQRLGQGAAKQLGRGCVFGEEGIFFWLC